MRWFIPEEDIMIYTLYRAIKYCISGPFLHQTHAKCLISDRLVKTTENYKIILPPFSSNSSCAKTCITQWCVDTITIVWWVMTSERFIAIGSSQHRTVASSLSLYLFGVLRPTRECYGDVIITGKGFQILICTRHLWPLRSERVCHTYYSDTGHPFIMVISEDPWHSNLLPRVWQWSCHYLFLRLGSVAAWIRTLNLLHARRAL